MDDVRVGIEIGHTLTAAAVDRRGTLVATARTSPGGDPASDVAAAVAALLAPGAIAREQVRAVMVACAYAEEALARRELLGRVAVVRLAARLDPVLEPLVTWPPELRAAIGARAAVLAGGRELDGSPAAALDESGLRRFLEASAGVEAVAIAGQLSVAAPDDEVRAAEVAWEVLGRLPVAVSHELGGAGLLERENAAILDAALSRRAGEIADGIRAGLEDAGIRARAYVVRDDGTLATLEYVRGHPTCALDGRAASGIRGAGHLAGFGDALVCDADERGAVVGRLSGGHPRERDAAAVGGVAISVRAPELVAVARTARERPGTSWAELLGDAIDGMKERHAGEPLIAVGSAHARVPDALPGVSRVVRPPHAEWARAIGAATAAVSGFVERLFPAGVDAQTRQRITATIAHERAVLAGAEPAGVVVDELEEIPLTYLPDLGVRVRARALGPLPPM